MQTPRVTDRPYTAVLQALPLPPPSTAANKTRSYCLSYMPSGPLWVMHPPTPTRLPSQSTDSQSTPGCALQPITPCLALERLADKPTFDCCSEAPAHQVCTVPFSAFQHGSIAIKGTGAVTLALLTAPSRPLAALSGARPCGQPAHKPNRAVRGPGAACWQPRARRQSPQQGLPARAPRPRRHRSPQEGSAAWAQHPCRRAGERQCAGTGRSWRRWRDAAAA